MEDFIIALESCSTGKSPVEISIFSSSKSWIKNEKYSAGTNTFSLINSSMSAQSIIASKANPSWSF